MTLSSGEKKQLEKLMAKQAQRLGNEELNLILTHVNQCYEYMDAFKALMIWNRFTENLATLAKDNDRLVAEVKALQDELREAKKAPPGEAQ